jgi:hypothetical protein
MIIDSDTIPFPMVILDYFRTLGEVNWVNFGCSSIDDDLGFCMLLPEGAKLLEQKEFAGWTDWIGGGDIDGAGVITTAVITDCNTCLILPFIHNLERLSWDSVTLDCATPLIVKGSCLVSFNAEWLGLTNNFMPWLHD